MSNLLDSRQLLNFVTLAQTGSFTETARQLNLTQSAISHSLKALEGDLGQKLFMRVGRRLHLTEQGELFRQESQEILRRMRQTRERVSKHGQWDSGYLRVGLSAMLCQFLLPQVLREFRQCFPECALQTVVADSPECLRGLLDNRLDLALVLREDEMTKDLTLTDLMEDDLNLVLSPTHPWANERSLPLVSFSQQTIIFYNRSSTTHLILTGALRREGLRWSNSIEVGSLEAIKELVRCGQGITFLAPWVVAEDVKRGRLVERTIPRFKARRSWCFAYAKGRRVSMFEETFMGLCLEARESLFNRNRVLFTTPPLNK
ncbi:MAG: LysR family transcriptional regulator [Opitutales bacterium]